MSATNRALTPRQLDAIEAYRRRLASELPGVEILEVQVIDGIVDIRLNDAAMSSVAVLARTADMACEVEEDYPDVVLLPRTIPHGD